MAVISRPCPGWVRQTQIDSCWAAVLEAWGRAEPLAPQVRQSDLIADWSDQPHGGISVGRMESLAGHYRLHCFSPRRRGLMGRSPITTIRNRLSVGYVMCIYSISGFSHSVLVYRIRDNDLSVMDPNGGRYVNLTHAWLTSHAPIGLLWR